MKRKKLTRKPAQSLDLTDKIMDQDRHLNINLILPKEFLLLCRLADINPQTLICDFIDHLSHGTWRKEGHEAQRAFLANYFITMNYMAQRLSAQQTRELFEELSALSNVHITGAGASLILLYEEWRNEYLKHWYSRWLTISQKQTPASLRV